MANLCNNWISVQKGDNEQGILTLLKKLSDFKKLTVEECYKTPFFYFMLDMVKKDDDDMVEIFGTSTDLYAEDIIVNSHDDFSLLDEEVSFDFESRWTPCENFVKLLSAHYGLPIFYSFDECGADFSGEREYSSGDEKHSWDGNYLQGIFYREKELFIHEVEFLAIEGAYLQDNYNRVIDDISLDELQEYDLLEEVQSIFVKSAISLLNLNLSLKDALNSENTDVQGSILFLSKKDSLEEIGATETPLMDFVKEQVKANFVIEDFKIEA